MGKLCSNHFLASSSPFIASCHFVIMSGVILESTQQSSTSVTGSISAPHTGHLSTGGLSNLGSTGRSSSLAGIIWPFLHTQNGKGVPKTLCLLITQSQSMLSAQSLSLRNISSGYQFISLATLIISSMRSFTLMNHCFLGKSSIGAIQELLSVCLRTLCFIFSFL
ncbi:164aa long hypothetical protein [Pyrococcus horikoshii OT3]|uniref:Uncharacterized protein n=1 Tax=Pyrococcus horikoshii (strain ATCC 700860 / DSM 12428 / JCM 9974 / NBRC 100139 / OT-3) TaxID=70601 RepID=O58053_PYRHO|nr:164aa long hypothetical protein [Pyrococcus horikoshii OT3]